MKTTLISDFLFFFLIADKLLFAQGITDQPKSFSIPLAIITTTFDGQKNLVEAFVTYDGLHEGWAISPTDDRYVKDTRRERIDYTYKEVSTQANYLSPFEAKIIDKVCESFQKTLRIFERDLREKKWGRLLYGDFYFPNFFKGFYYLIGAARVSYSSIPSISCVNDSLIDSGFVSVKGRERITFWASHEEYVVKLRITAKELDYQIGLWRKLELSNPNRDAWKDDSKPAMDAYALFLRTYFNL